MGPFLWFGSTCSTIAACVFLCFIMCSAEAIAALWLSYLHASLCHLPSWSHHESTHIVSIFYTFSFHASFRSFSAMRSASLMSRRIWPRGSPCLRYCVSHATWRLCCACSCPVSVHPNRRPHPPGSPGGGPPPLVYSRFLLTRVQYFVGPTWCCLMRVCAMPFRCFPGRQGRLWRFAMPL